MRKVTPRALIANAEVVFKADGEINAPQDVTVLLAVCSAASSPPSLF